MLQRARSRAAFTLIPVIVFVTFGVGCRRDPVTLKLRYVQSGDRYAAQSKYAEAAIEYRNAVSMDPLAGDVREKLGAALIATGNLPAALEQYVRAADLRPADAYVQLQAGSLLLVAGRFDDAKALAEKVLAADGRNVDAQILLANALSRLKDVDAAVAQLEGVVTKLSDPAIYSGPGAAVTELQREKARLEREVANAEQRWLAAQEAFEKAA